MKNFYEILEVSQNASREVINKAYKVLVKKYHPDLQQNDNDREEAKRKMQIINEAYETLNDDSKRKQYDEILNKEKELQIRKQQEIIINEQLQKEKQSMQKEKEQYMHNIQNQMNARINTNSVNNIQSDRRRFIESQINVGKNIIKSRKINKNGILKIILIIVGIFIFLWVFPPTHNLMVKLYEDNAFVRTVVDTISIIINGLINGIKEFFRVVFESHA